MLFPSPYNFIGIVTNMTLLQLEISLQIQKMKYKSWTWPQNFLVFALQDSVSLEYMGPQS